MSCSLLVVEDEPMIQFLWENVAECVGLTLGGLASTIVEALSLIGTNQFNCAVLDVNLNDGKSTEVAEQLAAQNIPFLVTTGDNPEDLPEVFSAGQILMKPFNLNQAIGIITEMCG